LGRFSVGLQFTVSTQRPEVSMLITHRRWAIALGLIAFAIVSLSGSVLAGTTGAIRGRVYDSVTLAPLQDVKVSAVAPSQSAATVTDSHGIYGFLSLGP